MTNLVQIAPVPRNELPEIRTQEDLEDALGEYDFTRRQVVRAVVDEARAYNLLVHIQVGRQKKPTPVILLSSFDERVKTYLEHIQQNESRILRSIGFRMIEEPLADEGIANFSIWHFEDREYYLGSVVVGTGLALMAPHRAP